MFFFFKSIYIYSSLLIGICRFHCQTIFYHADHVCCKAIVNQLICLELFGTHIIITAKTKSFVRRHPKKIMMRKIKHILAKHYSVSFIIHNNIVISGIGCRQLPHDLFFFFLA